MDLGRLFIMPVFMLLLAASMWRIYGDMTSAGQLNAVTTARLIQLVLTACFYAFLVFLYLIRIAPRSTTRSLIAKIVAVSATFLPFVIPLMGEPSGDPKTILFASLISISGITVTLYSLSALGRSFSIIPQARKLVQTGPYRLVRHPVYLGELIAIFGVVLSRFSVTALAIYCLQTALLIYRALEEEKLLAGIFPEYEAYALGRARFIPGIF